MAMIMDKECIIRDVREALQDKNLHLLDDDDLAYLYMAVTGRIDGHAADRLREGFRFLDPDEGDEFDDGQEVTEKTWIFSG